MDVKVGVYIIFGFKFFEGKIFLHFFNPFAIQGYIALILKEFGLIRVNHTSDDFGDILCEAVAII